MKGGVNVLKKVMRIVLAIIGSVIGYEVVNTLGFSSEISHPFWENIKQWLTSTQFIGIIVGFLAGFFIISYLLEKLLQLIINIEHKLKELSWKKIIIGISGLIIGLLFGVVISLAFPVLREYKIGQYIQVLINLVFAYLGFSIFISKEKDISRILERRRSADIDELYDDCISSKVLDTSVIIDGRIADICKTGFIEGTLLIPEFILEELRHIADSSDVLKRNRGRRGLDILKQMQKDPNIIVEIINQDFEELQEVDSKLVKLAQLMDARIVTNDYNLNKVAELQGVSVLNINDLANAVKPVVLPGEEMRVQVIKDGKEHGQGVAYLDDGTMIVIEGGGNYIGTEIDVVVTSVLQTSAGRMIFAKPKLLEKAL